MNKRHFIIISILFTLIANPIILPYLNSIFCKYEMVDVFTDETEESSDMNTDEEEAGITDDFDLCNGYVHFSLKTKNQFYIKGSSYYSYNWVGSVFRPPML